MKKTKIKLDPVCEHLVVPDTNILWDADKKNSVSPDFNTFWERNIPLIPLRLLVPEVVLGELQFQQATSAIKCASAITDNMAELSGITQSKYETLLDQQKVRKQVGEKLKKWVKIIGGSIEATPVDTIDWTSVINDAVWRNSPFTCDPKNKDNEKGFRDALILETLCSICEKNKGKSINIVFLCNDFLLRTSTEERLKHNSMLLIFESTSDFESYIKLTQQKLTDKFVKSIQSHARSKFYTPDDKNTLYYRENIKQLIKVKFEPEIALSSVKAPTFGLLGMGSNFNWSIIDERWWVNSTRFDELIQPREYHWVSRITLVRLLVGTLAGGGLSSAYPYGQVREEIQLIGFDIKWKANVKADGRFHDITLIEIIKNESIQEPSTTQLREKWKLQQTPNPTPPVDSAN